MKRVRLLDARAGDPPELRALISRRDALTDNVRDAVREIVERVRWGGDEALLELTAKYDRVDLSADRLRVGGSEIDASAEALSAELRASIDAAMERVRVFHEAQLPRSQSWTETFPGVWCGVRATPIESVCLYVPRGRGSFASVAYMLGVPAILAGVPRVAVVTPPGPGGEIDAGTLYVCAKVGVREVYRLGGAQAVAAVALGTETIKRCDKIVGPGNVYATAAKELLRGEIDPGPPAGPSESVVLCDAAVHPGNAAWNLLIEAEHGENSSAVLLVDDEDVARQIVSKVEQCIEQLVPRRRDYAARVLSERGGVVITRSLDDSVRIANELATEHLALMVSDPWPVAQRIRSAGEILFGDFPVISAGNYSMGVNAILPTGGRARTCSPVGVETFQKKTQLGFADGRAYDQMRREISVLSRDEDFCAHHLAAEAWVSPNGSEATGSASFSLSERMTIDDR